MTVIRHNSISGIVSITAAAGSNLSFYDSNGSNLSLDTGNINAGVITATTANFTNATVTGDLTVQGTTTTLDTTVTEVDKLEVGANNTTVGVAITQSGTGDILRLYDSSTQVVTVADGGNFGIGDTTPDEKLHVGPSPCNTKIATRTFLGTTWAQEGTVLGYMAKADTTNNVLDQIIQVGTGGNGAAALLLSQGAAKFFTNSSATDGAVLSTERARIDSSGRLLVGTSTAPTDSITSDALLVIQGYEGVATGDSLISLQRGQTPANIASGARLGSVYFGASDGSRYAQIHADADAAGGSSDYPGRLVFSTTADAGSAPTERMRIDSSGIIKANNSLRLANSGGGEAKLLYTGTSNDVYPELAGIYSDANYGVNTATDILIKTTAAGQTTPTERLRIDSNGNVGIGTDNPQQELHINSSGGGYAMITTINTGSNAGILFGDSDDNDIGSVIYENANDALTFTTNTQERLRITSSGQVAVNGGSPNANWGPFNVNVDGSNIMHIGYGANYDNYFTAGGSGIQVFRTAGTERFRIGAGGQIGLSGANYGTSGQVLTSQGSGAAPQWASVSAGFTSAGTALGMTGNANLTISSIPSSARQIVITLISAGPPTSQENDWLLMRVGTSSGVISSVIYAWNTSGGNNVNYSNGQAHVRLSGSWNNGSSTRQHGTIILNQFDANNWNSISLLGNTTQGDILVSGSATFGQSGLGTNLDRIFLFTGSGNPWTSGVVNLQYI